MPGTGELVIILLIVMVVFGASRLPMIGEGMGRAIRNFKKGLSNDSESADAAQSSEPKKLSSDSGSESVDSGARVEAEIVDKK